MADESAAVEAVEEQTPEESSESHGGSSAWIWNGHVTCDRILEFGIIVPGVVWI